jgi:hypothetical protein
MQIIQLKKIGTVLISRPAGLESFNAIRPGLNKEELIQIDFDQVLTVTPSWLDEFLTQLANWNGGKVELLPTKNPSVLVTLPVLGEARQDFVADIVRKALKRLHP